MTQSESLDAVLERLDRILAAAAPTQTGDALDRILAEPGRQTDVTSLRDSEIIRTFRQDLIDGLIRIDTANRLFRLISAVLDRLPMVGGTAP